MHAPYVTVMPSRLPEARVLQMLGNHKGHSALVSQRQSCSISASILYSSAYVLSLFSQLFQQDARV